MNTERVIKQIIELTTNPPKYIIGVFESSNSSYCLSLSESDDFKILLCNSRITITKKEIKKFNKEVKRLAKYFNAEITNQ